MRQQPPSDGSPGWERIRRSEGDEELRASASAVVEKTQAQGDDNGKAAQEDAAKAKEDAAKAQKDAAKAREDLHVAQDATRKAEMESVCKWKVKDM